MNILATKNWNENWNVGFRKVALMLSISLLGSAAVADETRTLTLDARNLRAMEIDTEAGFLDIQGVEGDQITVTAEIVADSGDYELELEERDGKAVLISDLEPWAAIFLAEWPRINLTVKVPARMELDIDDGSGYVKVQDMKSHLEIDDGSGDVIVRSHVGNVEIDDGSGEVDVSGVTGNVDIDDGSGSILVSNVIGNVKVDDGSGSMEIKNIDGHVTVRDGSGSIDIADVKRGLAIRESGSGSVQTRNIQGGFDGD